MRRECPACEQEYRTEPVIANGEFDGDRVHLICCSWSCLEEEIHNQDLCLQAN